MDDIRNFKTDDWIVSEDGVCQVLAVQDYAIEPFFAHKYPDKKLGEMFDRKLVCKLLCNFTPTIRKSKYIKVYSSKYCEPISEQYSDLKVIVQRDHPDQYLKFEKVKLNKPCYASLDFPIRVNPNHKDEIISAINDLLANRINSMDFGGVENLLIENISGIESPKISNKHADTLRSNVLITLYYDVLGANQNSFCFTDGEARSIYCASA